MTDTFTSRCYSGSWSHIVTDIPRVTVLMIINFLRSEAWSEVMSFLGA